MAKKLDAETAREMAEKSLTLIIQRDMKSIMEDIEKHASEGKFSFEYPCTDETYKKILTDRLKDLGFTIGATKNIRGMLIKW